MIYAFDRFAARKFRPSADTIAIRCISSPEVAKGRNIRSGLLKSSLYVDTLSLTFDDVMPKDMGYEKESGVTYTLFDINHANKIADFLEENIHQFEDIMVHCESGISRSTAIASCLGDHFRWEYNPEMLERGPDGSNYHVDIVMRSMLRNRFPDRVLTRIH